MAGASCSERALCEATRAIALKGPAGAGEEGWAHGGVQGKAQRSAEGSEQGEGVGQGRHTRVLTQAILEVIALQCTDYVILI